MTTIGFPIPVMTGHRVAGRFYLILWGIPGPGFHHRRGRTKIGHPGAAQGGYRQGSGSRGCL